MVWYSSHTIGATSSRGAPRPMQDEIDLILVVSGSHVAIVSISSDYGSHKGCAETRL